MKKILLTALSAGCLFAANAQQRMTLHEEFTGENCGPCASTNPGFWALLDTPANLTKVIHIAYMSPIPSSGWYYMRTQAVSDARISYYSVPFAPYGRYDGHVPDPTASSPGHPGYFTQADIDAEYATADSFGLTVTNAWNSTYDSVITTVHVACSTAYTASSFVLRAALVETNDFTSSPGSNGETHFEHVVQAMYPNAAGTTLPGTWTVGMNNTYVIRGAVPSYVDKGGAPFMVVWLQNESNKVIAQAAQATPLSPIPNDMACTGVTAAHITCAADGSTSVPHSVIMKNSGNNTVTSATVYYKIDAGTMLSTPWTGSLAPGATTTYTMPSSTVTVAGPGNHTIYDSVAMPNGTPDQSTSNNAGTGSFFVESNTTVSMPYSTSFARTDWGKHYQSDDNNNSEFWFPVWSGNDTLLGHGPDSFAYYFAAYNFAAGESEYFTLPKVATTSGAALGFYTSHCSYSATPENDKLEVIYSSDCGATWTSIWSKVGSALCNMPYNTALWWPRLPSQYASQSVSLSTVPSGAIIAFRGTSDYGNSIFVDDVRISTTLETNKMTQESLNISVFPNPAKDEATLSMVLVDNSDVQIEVVDGLGRTVSTVANGQMEIGAHNFTINTTSLPTGIYNVMIHTDNGTFTQRLNVVK